MKYFYKSFQVLCLVSFCFLVSCSRPEPLLPEATPKSLLSDGSITISRMMPGVANEPATRLLGFVPFIRTEPGFWLAVNTKEKKLTLMEGDKVTATTSGEGIDHLAPGVYQLLHKQRNALWYAPDSYFLNRQMKVPSVGDRNRYRRGALGDFVLFINKDTPIHSGPVWTDEVGGVRVEDVELSRIYYRLPIGARIEVK